VSRLWVAHTSGLSRAAAGITSFFREQISLRQEGVPPHRRGTRARGAFRRDNRLHVALEPHLAPLLRAGSSVEYRRCPPDGNTCPGSVRRPRGSRCTRAWLCSSPRSTHSSAAPCRPRPASGSGSECRRHLDVERAVASISNSPEAFLEIWRQLARRRFFSRLTRTPSSTRTPLTTVPSYTAPFRQVRRERAQAE